MSTIKPFQQLPVTVEMAKLVGDDVVIASCTQALTAIAPAVCVYACTSGSFVHGVRGEHLLVDAMRAAGAPCALTCPAQALEEAFRDRRASGCSGQQGIRSSRPGQHWLIRQATADIRVQTLLMA
ncbi:MAG: hypothetical protein ACR2KG_03615 [Nocardioidaceae bacterium]